MLWRRLNKAQEELDVVTSQLQEKQEKLYIIEGKVCSGYHIAWVSAILFRLQNLRVAMNEV